MPGTSFVGSTSNQDINGLLTGVRWTPNSLSFSFPASASFYSANYGDGEPNSGFAQLNATQQSAVRTIFQDFSAVANLTFTEITETASVHADLRLARSTVPSTAWAYYPSGQEEGGDSWFRNSSTYNNPEKGNYAYLTFVHEIGHALGLKHGHETDTYGAMTFAHDSMEYSVMTYRSFVGDPASGGYANENWGYAQSLMMYDIAALQTMYGANYNTNSGNTTYGWSPTTGELFVNGEGQGASGGNRIFMTIWDGGGFDVYDFSNYTTSVTVNLAPGSWTTTSAAQLAHLDYFDTNTHVAAGNIANALLFNNNTQSSIEAAYGGAGNDNVVGNQADNVLNGNAGNDIIDGVAGNDTLNGGGGNDAIWGGAGDDTFVFSAGADAIKDFVAGAGGVDEIDLRAVSGITSLADVLARATQSGAHTVIDFGSGNTLTLENINKNNLVSSDFLFSAPPSAADLTAGGLVLNGTSISFTINNVGVDPSAASTTGVYLSTDSTITSADTLVTSVSTSSLTAGGSVTQGTTLNFPTNLAVGTYYLGVLADYSGQVTESSDTNNASNTVAVILGNSSANTFAGTSAADTLIGLAGDDTINGGVGNDLILGGDGVDRMDGGAGADTYDGGAGYDYARYMFASAGVTASLANPVANTGDAAGDSYIAIEGLVGSAFNDTLIGDGADNQLWGIEGNDTFDGGGGNDAIWGGAGDDTFVFSAGADAIKDFVAGAGGIDEIDLRAVSGITSLADVLARATQSGAHTVIDFGSGNTLTLENINKNNLVSSDFLFSAPPSAADLTAGGLVLNGTSISFTINNVGVDPSAASTTGVYLSTDSTITSADTLVTSVSTSSLTAGGSVTQGTTLNFPTNLAVGTYYLGVLADYSGQVTESSDTNNASNTVAVILGNSSANTFAGTSAADTLIGLAGDDTINGGVGNDLILGGDGVDRMDGGAGADTYDGGAGYDYARYMFASAGVTASLANPVANTGDAAGDSYIAIEGLVGSAFNDTLIGDGADNQLWGIEGNDTFDGGGGNDAIWGGAGDDTFVFSAGADAIKDFVAGAGGIDEIDLRAVSGITSLADVLARATQSGAHTVIDFGSGNTLTLENINKNNLVSSDFLFSAPPSAADLTAGGLVLNGTSISFTINNVGVDPSAASTTGVYLSTDSTITSADTLVTSVSTSSLTAGGSVTQGTTLNFPTNLAVGTYYLGVLADYSGQVTESSDTNNASNTVAVILGNSSANTFAGTSAADTLIGLAGDDTINGGVGNDLILGGDGVDRMDGGAGADTYDGGAGYDYARYMFASAGVTASLANPVANTGDAAGDSYIAIEGLVGSAFNDTLIGDGADNQLWGIEGNDTFDGGGGNDAIWGGAGDDTFVFSAGADAIRDFVAGASGIDEIDLRAVSGITSLADVLARATQSGAHTVIDFGGGNTLTLDNINKNNLVSSDFLFS